VTQASSHHIRFRGRSFPVLALELDAPLDGWIERLDACLERSPAFFARKSVVIDVSRLNLDRVHVIELVENLVGRGVRIMGLTGVEPSWESPDLPPILTGGRALSSANEPANCAAPDEAGHASLDAAPQPEINLTQEPPLQPSGAAPLVIEATVRSGQSIFHPEGDVIVIGSVASGADVSAGGSVHIYGTLRGRVMAGIYGEARARIFCRRLEAELLAVGGVYMTADEFESDMRGLPIHAWLEDETVKLAKLD
jgi:septum site-determining protein MinC